MNKKAVMSTVLLGLVVLGLGCAVVWRNMSRKYIAKWDMPKGGAARPPANTHGNVCIVQNADGTSEPLACADVHLFPAVYSAIGVDENTIGKWQDEHGFHSGGVTPTGALLAPDYPIFSRLAWTLIDPVYLQGDDLPALLEESKRIAEGSNDPAVRANLDRLLTLAEKAKAESKVLRFFG
jgi:hypothetical protein